MKTRILTIIIAMAATVCVQAQTQYNPSQAMQSQAMYQSGSEYTGTVYEPFSSVTPSEQSNVGAAYSPAQAPSGRRKEGEGGDQTQDGRDATDATGGTDVSPIGDAVLPMMLMAMGAVGVIAYRRRKEA